MEFVSADMAAGLPGTLLEAATRAESADNVLLSGRGAVRAVASVLDVATAIGVTHLYGASASGERLVGAALVQAAGSLSLWTPGPGGNVLVVDGIVASTMGLVQSIAMVQRLGAEEVYGVAIAGIRCDGELPANDAVTLLKLPVVATTAA